MLTFERTLEEATSHVLGRATGYSLPILGWGFSLWEARPRNARDVGSVIDRLASRASAKLRPMSIASESTVRLDSGWVTDGHFICWNGVHGAMLHHPEHCPFVMEGKFKVYVCSPSLQTAAYGVTLDDLPEDEAAACREVSDIGSEPIRWRLIEHIHPDLSIEEQNRLSIFSITLDHAE